MNTEPAAGGRDSVEELYGDYLRDESNFRGFADAVFFPRTAEELKDILQEAGTGGMDITVSAGRTGITGGAVPEGGWLVSLEKMDRFLKLRYDEALDEFFVTVQAGVRLSALQEAVVARDFPGSAQWDPESIAALDRLQASPGRYFYAPDPTETDSSLGGNAACNASGARTYKYGATRNHIRSLKVLLPDGTTLDLERGTGMKFKDDKIVLPMAEGSQEVILPQVRWPVVKNASGYCLTKEMDYLDLFIGSEGTLGVITELELRLVPAPLKRGEVLIQMDSEGTALDIIEILEDTELTIATMEYFCPRALRFLKEHGKLEGFDIQISQGSQTPALLLELEFGEEGLDPQLERLAKQLETWKMDTVATLVATDPADLERFRHLRHSLPETINEVIARVKADHPGVSKLGLDFAVPRARVHEMVKRYHEVLGPPGIDYVLFGHIGNDHIHVNIIPRDQQEYDAGKKAYRQLAKTAVDLGGTVSAEHGIGKLKKDLLLLMYGEDEIEKMRAVKEALDPNWMLGQGTLFYRRGSIQDCSISQ